MPSRRPTARQHRQGLPGEVVFFPGGNARRQSPTLEQLGWKGLSLVRMASARLPVPPGFILPTGLVQAILAGRLGSAQLTTLIARALTRLDRLALRTLGIDHPRLYAIRCSPTMPLPGLMPSILNVGLTQTISLDLRQRGEAEFASDCLARLIPAYARQVLSLPERAFDAPAAPPESPDEAAARCQRTFQELTGTGFALGPLQQLVHCILAAVRSWQSPRTQMARRRQTLTGAGLAIVVQAMVFGNRDSHSATGMGFTRDVSTGQNELRGEYLPGAQAEDLVSGVRPPLPIESMRTRSPRLWQYMDQVRHALEATLGDAQDFGFVVERGRLYLLHARQARRSSTAAIRLAVELADDGIISQDQALQRVEPTMLESQLHPALASDAIKRLIAAGLPASPGAAAGRIAFTAEEVIRRAAAGETLLLVRQETDAADVTAMARCAGILTSSGGMTSHAAVVARGLGVPCIVGASDLLIDPTRRRVSAGDKVFTAGDALTIDGTRGELYEGQVPIVPAVLSVEATRLLQWADTRRGLRVYGNADTPADAALARSMGAQAIGLCRTEHMFFHPDRVQSIRQMIMADPQDNASRQTSLERLLPMQRDDFIHLLEIMEGAPVQIRLIDPPIHEFLPRGQREVRELAATMGRSPAQLEQRIEQLREANPMLGHRGSRLLVTTPQILAMQVRAIIEAAAYCLNWGRAARPAILIPMVMDDAELAWLIEQVRHSASATMRRLGVQVPYQIGTMIEVPRAALLAARLAPMVDFFSFGTNDLTQMACGISRDDSQGFMPHYVQAGVFAADPFVQLDLQGVGQLVEMAVKAGRRINPRLQCGLCGEQAADPATVQFCQDIEMDYVSCSPYRIPAARLAAARAALASR